MKNLKNFHLKNFHLKNFHLKNFQKSLLFKLFLFLFISIFSNISFSENLKLSNEEIYKVNKIFELYYNQKFEECMRYCYDIIEKDVDNTSAYVFYFASSFQIDKLQETVNQVDEKYIKFVQEYNSSKKEEIIETNKTYQKLSIFLAYSNLFLYYVSPNSLSYLDESINIFRKSLFFPVSFSSIYTGLAIAYYEKKLNERALSMINKALNIKPYDPISLEYYGKINNSLGNYSQTINKLRSYTNIKYPDMIYQLAIAYEKTDKIDEAIDTYLLVYQYDPYLIGQGFISLIRIGDIYLNIKKDKEKAISYYQEVLKVLPDSLVAKQKIEEANKK
ncbi:MAG: tetratricopeptide repeat protein [bacterium]